jgi:hypothetical protein
VGGGGGGGGVGGGGGWGGGGNTPPQSFTPADLIPGGGMGAPTPPGGVRGKSKIFGYCTNFGFIGGGAGALFFLFYFFISWGHPVFGGGVVVGGDQKKKKFKPTPGEFLHPREKLFFSPPGKKLTRVFFFFAPVGRGVGWGGWGGGGVPWGGCPLFFTYVSTPPMKITHNNIKYYSPPPPHGGGPPRTALGRDRPRYRILRYKKSKKG